VAATPELTPTQRDMDARDWSFGGSWSYEPHWLFTDDIRIHYVDEGPRSPEAVVLLHGTPFWAFAFRDEIARLARDGTRVVAYDQLGFGRSDKPERESEYSLERDVAHLGALVDALGLQRVTLRSQTSALLVARGFASASGDRVAAVEEVSEPRLPSVAWRPVVGRVLVKGARWPIRRAELTDEERAAYLAPHPSWASRSGVVASLRRRPS
jgi:haloalkane dehalogenase